MGRFLLFSSVFSIDSENIYINPCILKPSFIFLQ